jgi:hypothetical protein
MKCTFDPYVSNEKLKVDNILMRPLDDSRGDHEKIFGLC